MSNSTTNPTVAAMLAAAGLPVSSGELSELSYADQSQRPLVDSLYAVTAARYADPALIFSAEVVSAPWDRD